VKLNYYPDTDSLYIDLSSKPSAESREVSEGIVLDYDADGNLVGIDIDNASHKLDLSEVGYKPHPGRCQRIAKRIAASARSRQVLSRRQCIDSRLVTFPPRIRPPFCLCRAAPTVSVGCKSLIEKGPMEHIRIKVSVHLNQNHALTEKDLETFKPAMERAIAGSLPATINVDTVKVTKIKEVASATVED
jgi:uncharacterized protein YuzE